MIRTAWRSPTRTALQATKQKEEAINHARATLSTLVLSPEAITATSAVTVAQVQMHQHLLATSTTSLPNFEETFGMAWRKQNTVVAILRDCPDRDNTACSIPSTVGLEGPRSAADDGAADMERLVEAVRRGDIGHNYLSKREIENGFPFSRNRRAVDERHRPRTFGPNVFPR